MKSRFTAIIANAFLLLLTSLFQLNLMAQDSNSSSSSVTVTKESTTTTTWYTQPWVWVVGGAVFILLLIALIRGNSSSKDTEVSRTTVIKDRNV